MMRLGLAVVIAALWVMGLSQAMLPEQPIAKRDTPFYLTPHIDGLDLMREEGILKLKNALDDLEPQGATGQVQVGFTLGIDLYHYFQKDAEGWIFNRAQLQDTLKKAASIERPVVIYVASNHFFASAPYVAELEQQEGAVMRFQDGSVPVERYFGSALTPLNLSIDASLPHIAAKQQALQVLAEEIHLLGNRLAGITLNGETHYLFDDFFSGTGRFDGARYSDDGNSGISPAVQSYEWGIFPIHGWYCGHKPVAVYHQGKRITYATTGLSRLDVYEQVPHITNANCGFRADIDFSEWEAGDYALQIVTEQGRRLRQMPNGRVILRIGKSGEALITKPRYEDMPDRAWQWLRAEASGWVDSTHQAVQYRPEVQAWRKQREQAILAHVQMMKKTLVQHGVPEKMIYSYQLAPWLKADWNEVLFGIGRDFFKQAEMQAGITLYGGLTMNPHMLHYLPGGKPYAVPEFHPQMHKDADYALAALRFHQRHGASFLSPYFISLIDINSKPDEYGRMRIAPDNPERGSDYFYHALKTLAAE